MTHTRQKHRKRGAWKLTPKRHKAQRKTHQDLNVAEDINTRLFGPRADMGDAPTDDIFNEP